MVYGQVAELGEVLHCLFTLSDVQQPAWGFRAKEDAQPPDSGWQELEQGWKHPLRVGAGVAFGHSVVDEETENDAELLAGGVLDGEEASNGFRGNLPPTKG